MDYLILMGKITFSAWRSKEGMPPIKEQRKEKPPDSEGEPGAASLLCSGAYPFRFCRLPYPTSPTSPVPSNSRVEGSGTAAAPTVRSSM